MGAHSQDRLNVFGGAPENTGALFHFSRGIAGLCGVATPGGYGVRAVSVPSTAHGRKASVAPIRAVHGRGSSRPLRP